MPELPEVETTVRDLRKNLVGLRFKDVWTDWPKAFKKAGGFEGFKKVIRNKKILSVNRKAKFIVIDIDGKYSIFIHQKISGHLLYGRWQMANSKWVAKGKGPLRDDPGNKYIRTIWSLNNGCQLAFSDLRRFGKIILVKDEDLSDLREIKELGPEPLEISSKKFQELFYPSTGLRARRRGRIKQVLMDPFFIAGIGNIYSDEILWDAGIHPLSRAENLSDPNLKKIYNSTQKILKKAIKAGGTSIEDYRKPSGEKGRFQNYTKAYHQTDKKCAKNDSGIIKRIKVGGRSAHFCPVHQKLVD